MSERFFALRNAAIVLIGIIVATTTAAAAERGDAGDARLALQLYPQRLAELGLTVGVRFEAGRADSPLRAEFVSRAGALGHLTDDGVYRRLDGGRLSFDNGFDLRRGDRALSLREFVLTPGSVDTFELLDANGDVIFVADHLHPRLDRRDGRLSFAFADLRVAPALARWLGDPAYAGEPLGTLTLTATVDAVSMAAARGAGQPDPLLQCYGREPNYRVNFNDTPADDLAVDIELTEIAHVGCGVCGGDDIPITPSVSLRNVGPADVAWYWRLTGPAERADDFADYRGFIDDGGWVPDYDRQHPYLVWALYRRDDSGLTMLGRSAVKHAFNAINDDCPCAEGKVFWSGCGDTYGFGTNDNVQHLGPRDEIDAATARWRFANSNFDPDNDLIFNQDERPPGRAGRYYERLTLPATELAKPGEYFLEGWYLVDGDRNIFNSLGYVRIEPALIGQFNPTWSFPILGELRPGPVIGDWVDMAAPAAGERSERLCSRVDAATGCERGTDGQGHLQLAVKTERLDDGRYRYRYALMNFDYDRQIETLALPLPAGVTIDEVTFRDADLDADNDWRPQRDADSGELRWSAPGPQQALDWGTMYAFGFIADAAPGDADARLVALTADETLAIATLTPDAADEPALFEDQFEAPAMSGDDGTRR